MKRALIIAAGCALLAGPASAQSSPPGPDRDGDRWSTATCAGIATGAATGSGVIGMTAQEVEAETGMGAGAITAGTNVAQAFCSRAEIHALR